MSEQYPKGLGHTVAELAERLPEGTDADREAALLGVRRGGLRRGRSRPAAARTWVVAGIETHVCVNQTVLDLIARGYRAYVAADAVSSRTPANRDLALERMAAAGAQLTSAEMALFEMLEVAGTPEFKTISRLVQMTVAVGRPRGRSRPRGPRRGGAGHRPRGDGLHHRHDRLPGGGHRPLLHGPDPLLHRADGGQLRRRARPRRERPPLAGRGDHGAGRATRREPAARWAGAPGCASAASWRSRTATRGAWCGACATTARCAAASPPSSTPDELLERVRAHPVLDGRDLASEAAGRAAAAGRGRAARRGDRLRDEGEHRPGPGRAPAAGSRWCRPAPARGEVLARDPDARLRLQRPGRPGGGDAGHRRRPRAARAGAGLRHLPRSPDAGPGARAVHAQAGVRPPRRQPPGAPLRRRAGGDHGAEPRLRGGGRRPARRRGGDAHEPLRRLGGGHRRARAARLVGAVPPRGEPRAARRALHVPRVRAEHRGGG